MGATWSVVHGCAIYIGQLATKSYVDTNALRQDGTKPLTGNWATGGKDVTGLGNVSLAAGKTFILGSYDVATEATLVGTLVAADKGKTWFNTASNTIKYWDGSVVVTLGVAGSGLSSLNGQTGSSQSFAVSSSGTGVAWTSAANTHTLSIPLAATAGVGAGLVSNADYTSFSSKLSSITAGTGLSGGVITGAGTVSLPNVGTIGTYVKITTDAQGRITAGTTLSPADIPPLSASAIASGQVAIANGGTGLGSTPADGQILVGRGGAYVLGALAAGPSGSIIVGNAAGSITLDTAQSVTVTATPSFADATLTALSPSTLVTTDAGSKLVSAGASDVISTLGYTPVNRAGDTLTGDLTLQTHTLQSSTLIVGSGDGTGAAGVGTLRGAAMGSADKRGQNLTIAAANGTGTGGSGAIFFQTAAGAASGSQSNTLTTALAINPGGNVGVGVSSATSAFDVGGAITTRGVAAPATSAAGQGRIYFDSVSGHFFVSESGGAYSQLATGSQLTGGTLTNLTAGAGLSGGAITTSGTISLPAVGSAGTYTKIVTDAFGRVSGATSLVAADLPPLSTSMLTTGTLPVAAGGTGVSAFTNNGILIGSGSLPVGTITLGAQYNSLTAGPGGVPGFGQVALNQSAAVTGTLAATNGGTGLASLGSANQILGVVGAGGALEYKSLVGTTSEITISNSAGTLQLATPQAIATSSVPTFSGMTLSGNLGVGNANPSSLLDVSGALTERGIAAPSLSSSGQGVIYFDTAAQHFMVSENGSGFQTMSVGVAATVVTAGGGLNGGTFATNGTISLPTIGTVGTFSKITTDAYGRVNGSASLVAADLPTVGTVGTYAKVVTDAYGRVVSAAALGTADLPTAGTIGTYAKVVTDAYGRVVGSSTLLATDLPTAGASGTYAKVITDAYGRVVGSSTLVAADLPNVGASGTYAKVVTDAYGRVVGSASLVAADLPPLSTSMIGAGTLPVANGGTGLSGGTSGGIPYYAGASTLASSGVLAANAVLLGGGIGAAPTTAAALANGQLLIGATGGAPVAATLSTAANQGVTIANAAGTIQLGTAQDIRTTASPTFAALLIPANGNVDLSGYLTERATATPALSSVGSGVVYFDSVAARFKISENGGAFTQLATGGSVTSVSAGAGLSGGSISTAGTIGLPAVGTIGTYAKVITDAYGRVSGAASLVAADLPAVGTSGTYTKVLTDAYGRVTGSTSLVAADLPPLSTSMLASGTLPVAAGGTGVATFTNNGLLVGSGSLPIGTVTVGSQYNVLTAGVAGAPGFGQVALNQSAAVTGTLPASNGGTGLVSLGSANQILGVVGAGGALEYKSLVGTASEITVSNAAGTLQLATPQAIATTSVPTFGGMSLSGNLGIGNSNPGSLLDVSGALTERGIAAPAVSSIGQGIIYFDTAAHHFMVSENGGAFLTLSSGVAATSVTAGAGLNGGTFATNGTISLPSVGTAGTYAKVITDVYGRVTGSMSLVAADLPPLSTSMITAGTLPVTSGGTGLSAGTAGGIPYFSSASTIASSAALGANGIVLGGGSGSAPTTTAALTNGQLLIGVTGGAPVGAALTTASNQGVTITNAAGTIQLGTAQDIRTTATPTFAAMLLPAGASVDLSGYLTQRAMATPPSVSSANSGVLYFDTSANKFKVSENGGAYTTLQTGGSVTNVSAGAGLSGGSISSSGTISMPTLGSIGTYTKVITDAYGRVSSGATLTAADLPAISATTITTGTLAVANGGTGVTTFTNNGVVIGSGTALSATGAGSQYNLLTVGAGGIPAFGQVNLASSAAVSGMLPVGNGGTGLATGNSGGIPYFSSASSIASSGVLTANGILLGGGAATAPTAAAVLGNGQLLIGTTGAPAVANLTSTGNGGVIVTNGSGSIGLATVQDIRTTASPSFVGLTLSGSENLGSGAVQAATHVAGTSDASATPVGGTVRSANATGLNIPGATLTIAAGDGTGTGASGAINFQTAPAAASSSTADTLATAMTIANSGNVGIGDTAPNARLGLGTSIGTDILNIWDGSAAGRYGFGIQSNELQAYVPSAGHFSFNSGGDVQTSGSNEVMRIMAGGNIGIGTSSPVARMDVVVPSGTGVDTDGAVNIEDGSGANQNRLKVGVNSTSSYAYLQSTHSNVSSSAIALNPVGGNVGIGTASPAARLDIYGADSAFAGPHLMVHTAADGYPLYEMLNWSHNNIAMNFDMYFNGNWASSYSGSNYQIYKMNNLLQFNYGSGVAQGSNISLATAMTLNTAGTLQLNNLLMPSVGNSASYGIMWPNNPGGGGGDSAWLRYWVKTGEDTELQIGIDNDANDTLGLWQFGAERVTVYNGNVGINNTAPTSTLDVNGTIRATAYTSPTSGVGLEFGYTNGQGYIQSYNRNSSSWVPLNLNGSTVTYNNESDKRLKTNIVDLEDPFGLDGILKLRPVSYDLRDADRAEQQGRQVGLIAQEVQKEFPKLVNKIGTDDTIVYDDGRKETVHDVLSLNYNGFIVPLIKAVQDLYADWVQDHDAIAGIQKVQAEKNAEIAKLTARLDQAEAEAAAFKVQAAHSAADVQLLKTALCEQHPDAAVCAAH